VLTSRQFLPEPFNASIKKLLSGSNLAIDNVMHTGTFVNTHDLVAAGTDAVSRPYLRQMRWPLEPDFAQKIFLDLAVPGQRLWPAWLWARHGKDTANYHLVQKCSYSAKMRKCLYYSHPALSLRFSEVETKAFETTIKSYKTIQHGKFVMKLNFVTGTSFLKNPQAQIGMLALGFRKSAEIFG